MCVCVCVEGGARVSISALSALCPFSLRCCSSILLPPSRMPPLILRLLPASAVGQGREGAWEAGRLETSVAERETGGGLVPSSGSGETACLTHKRNDSGRSWRFVGKENDREVGVMLGGDFGKGCRSGEERVER